jgi:hypothetical protein
MEPHFYYTCRQQESTKQVHCLISTTGYKPFDSVFGYSYARYLAIPMHQVNLGIESRTVLGALFNVKGDDVRFA